MLVAGVIFFINRASGLRRSLERQVATVSEASPIAETKMKKYFNSNEKLEYCTVDVTENGQITIATQPYHAPELERLGCPPNPTHSIRGRVTMSYDRKEFIFAPYAEGARKPTYQKQVVVGSTTLAVTEDKVKISFMVPRHLEKRLMLLYVQSEIDEVKRRLETDVYDMLKADPLSPAVGSQARRLCESKDSVSATDAFASAPSMGSTETTVKG